MAAALNLLPRSSFELTLTDGTVFRGQFGTWALNQFSIVRKLPLSKIGEIFGEAMQLNDMIDYIVYAVQGKEMQEKKPITFNAIKFCEWLDDYVFDTGDRDGLTKLFTHSTTGDPEEKKSQQEVLNGAPSSGTPVLQE